MKARTERVPNEGERDLSFTTLVYFHYDKQHNILILIPT